MPLDDSYDQPTTSEIKAGDEVRYTPSGEGTSEERAVVLKVHPDLGGAHYTIRTLGKDGKEKNTEASRISKVSEGRSLVSGVSIELFVNELRIAVLDTLFFHVCHNGDHVVTTEVMWYDACLCDCEIENLTLMLFVLVLLPGVRGD